ncbi:HpcH/HpaI aldolase/citrate lyase family protein [Aurantiacibacter poecillastricola]|uniref:HpcH/HpaI aldolase/citrate lyase family protein n=1 Tax=Aurantiacibacter poecillastricola TaxID=3064385 RepID=UPI00273D85D0|nr:CoA ester lyase [Aurantiacibacter sp. 219JJ12-13]MDP5261327.1 CoA ester lyase [Aurantiacibacter sp. 219JJ12-13]
MRLRSLLFVPADRPERFAKAAESGADAIIIDLEDSVAPENKVKGREAVAEFLQSPPEVPVIVRVNPLDGDETARDLAAVLPCPPAGVMLPKAEGAKSIAGLARMMDGAPIPVLPICTETAAAIFELGTYREVTTPLMGLTWGAEDLPAAIGATTAREADGSYTSPYEMVRSLTLFAAHAAGVPAIETVYPDIRNTDGLAAYAARGRRDGFVGMMAIHPAQVSVINEAFAPSADEVARAQAIVDAFEANPGAGALQLDGKMIDRPHLVQARRLLAQAGE